MKSLMLMTTFGLLMTTVSVASLEPVYSQKCHVDSFTQSQVFLECTPVRNTPKTIRFQRAVFERYYGKPKGDKEVVLTAPCHKGFCTVVKTHGLY